MERERNETYERIPWEMLERKGNDRQWVLFAVAGMIVIGALAYSFMSNRPVEPAPIGQATASSVISSAPPQQPVAPAVIPPADPVVVSEADLYAVDSERMLDQAAAHAEWFVAEYFTVDGSEETARTLAGLLPIGLSVGEQPEGIRVFVEWVRATEVEELAAFRYRIKVLVRYLKADSDGIYLRQAPIYATVEIVADETGPHVMLPPIIEPVSPSTAMASPLGEVPQQVATTAAAGSGATEVMGGLMRSDGLWQVVVMAPGPDGVIRPQTVLVP